MVPMRIALFVICLTDTLFPATGLAVVRLLQRLGHQVEFPEGQTWLRPDALQHRLPAGEPAHDP
jgi:hypothetical protein